MLECPICKKQFDETKENGYTEYANHVQKCCHEAELKQKSEDMKKINEKLEELKRAKICYEGLRDKFKYEYPDVYKANFSTESEKKINPQSYKRQKDFTSLNELLDDLFEENFPCR